MNAQADYYVLNGCLPEESFFLTSSGFFLTSSGVWIIVSEFGSTRFGGEEGLLHTVLQCVVNTQWCVPPDQRFDLLVLVSVHLDWSGALHYVERVLRLGAFLICSLSWHAALADWVRSKELNIATLCMLRQQASIIQGKTRNCIFNNTPGILLCYFTV